MANFNERSKAAYNEKADHYDLTFDGKFTKEFKRLLLSTITLSEHCNVLDVACGNGSLLAALNRQTPINGFGIDIADQMIKNAAINNPGMKFDVSECVTMPFENNTMDVITVCAAYHHFPDTAAFAQEAYRVLKANEKLYIAEVYYSKILRLLFNPFVPLSKAGDVKFYSSDEIVDNFRQFGFGKEKVEIAGHIQIVSMQKF